MNLKGCEDYLTKMDFQISPADIERYNEAFCDCCAKLRGTGEIIPKDDYTDAELLAYTLRVMAVLTAEGDPMVRRLRYLLDEGFLRMHEDGCLYEQEHAFKVLTEADFSEADF